MFIAAVLSALLVAPGATAVAEHPLFTPVSPAVLIQLPEAVVAPVAAPVGCPAPVDDVEQAFVTAFAVAGRAGCVVAVIRCEGWNATANYDLTHISPTSDVGPAQINQIHGQRGGIIAGRWPEAVQTLEGNIWAALELHRQGGWYPWKNSRHCHGQY